MHEAWKIPPLIFKSKKTGDYDEEMDNKGLKTGVLILRFQRFFLAI